MTVTQFNDFLVILQYTYPPHDNLNGQIYPGKPTVEVHPMPAPRNSFNSLSKNNIVPPPIPKKPERLKKLSNSSTGKYSVSFFWDFRNS